MLRNMKISYRLMLITGVTLVLMFVTGLYAIYEMGNLAGLTAKLYRHPYAVSTSVIAIDRNIMAMDRAMKDVLLAKDDSGIDKAEAAIANYESEVFELLNLIDERFLGERQLLSDAMNGFRNWTPIRDEVMLMMRIGAPDEAYRMAYEEGAAHVAEMIDLINRLKTSAQQKAEIFAQNADSTYKSILIQMVIALGVALVLGIILPFLIALSLIRPLGKLTKTIIEVEQSGDFTTKTAITSTDETGKTAKAFDGLMDTMQAAFADINRVMGAMLNADLRERITNDYGGNLNGETINKAMKLLGDAIFKVATTAGSVSSGASQLQSSAQAMAAGTSQQAASLEEISSSMNVVDAQAKANNDNAQQAQQLSSRSIDSVNRGNSQMETMQQSMNEINNTSNEVAKVIKVIDEIAFQTNLLALNAAVEAARAGKYGKGFAVVAEEVRNLASRSAEAARNTTELIETSLKEVDKGVKNAAQTAEMLTEINENVTKVNDLVGEISAGSSEQTGSVEEINTSLSQINNVVQHNSSISEETSSAADELSNQADELQHLMAGFKLVERVDEQDTFEDEVYEEDPMLENSENRDELLQIENPEPDKPQKAGMITLDDDHFGKY